MRLNLRAFSASILALAVQLTHAQDSASLHTRSLAATCANCHGTDGQAASGSAVPSLAGMESRYIAEQFRAFRDGKRPATVMHQLAKGFSEQQIDAIAGYFSALKK